MAKTDKFEKVKRFYDDGLWNAAQVAAAVGKGWITAAEYESIVVAGQLAMGTEENQK